MSIDYITRREWGDYCWKNTEQANKTKIAIMKNI